MTDAAKRFRLYDETGERSDFTEIAKLISAEDIDRLEALRGTGWQLNEKVRLTQYSNHLVLEVALVHRKYKVLDYLLSKGADLNVPRCPAMPSAVHTRDTRLMDGLIEAGADVRATNNVGYDALTVSVSWEYFELIPYLETKGVAFRSHSGRALDCAVFGGHLDVVEYALKTGANPNAKRGDEANQTSLHTAVLRNNKSMVELLLRHGADPLASDINGVRPFHYALAIDELNDLAQFLRTLEPVELHDVTRNAGLARSLNAPEELVARLSSSDLTLGRAEDGTPGIHLLSLQDVCVLHWQGNDFLMLSRRYHDDYCLGEYVWCPKRRKVCAIDNEHDELFVLGTWDEFSADPDACLRRVW